MMSSAAQWLDFHSADALAQALAADVATRLTAALLHKPSASLVVSGGATPYPFFAALKQKQLPWQRIHMLLTDERCVPTDHADSNEAMLRARLLTTESPFVSLAPRAGESSQQAIARITPSVLALAPFDVLVLGMGIDSHVASLFPGNPAIADTSNAALLAVEDAPKPPAKRISMAPQTILNAQHLVVHVTGDGKKTMIEEAMASGDVIRYPIAAFLLQQKTPVTVYWAP